MCQRMVESTLWWFCRTINCTLRCSYYFVHSWTSASIEIPPMSPRFCTNIYGQKVLEQICKLDHMFLPHTAPHFCLLSRLVWAGNRPIFTITTPWILTFLRKWWYWEMVQVLKSNLFATFKKLGYQMYFCAKICLTVTPCNVPKLKETAKQPWLFRSS